jgi:signal transduction histidine kinase
MRLSRWRGELQRSADRWLDPFLAVALFTAAEIEVLTADYREGPAWANAVLIALMTLPLAWRRSHTLLSISVIAAASLLLTVFLTDLTVPASLVFLVIIPPYTAGAWLDRRRAAVGLAIYLALGIVVSSLTGGFDDYVFTTVFAVASWFAGRAVRARRLLAVELEGRTERLEAERESRARLAVADERTRIARELHAVVANSVSEMVVEAEAAERLLEHDVGAAEDAMSHVEVRGREALQEMRRILGVLRRDGEGPQLEPQAGIAQLPTLVESARAEGLDVEMRVEGEPWPLSLGVDLTAYRILQGGLRDLRSQGPGSRGSVDVRYGEEALEIVLADDGPVTGRFREEEGVAVRERVQLWGGTIEWGPGPDGRFRVAARLPRVYDEVTA